MTTEELLVEMEKVFWEEEENAENFGKWASENFGQYEGPEGRSRWARECMGWKTGLLYLTKRIDALEAKL